MEGLRKSVPDMPIQCGECLFHGNVTPAQKLELRSQIALIEKRLESGGIHITAARQPAFQIIARDMWPTRCIDGGQYSPVGFVFHQNFAK